MYIYIYNKYIYVYIYTYSELKETDISCREATENCDKVPLSGELREDFFWGGWGLVPKMIRLGCIQCIPTIHFQVRAVTFTEGNPQNIEFG